MSRAGFVISLFGPDKLLSLPCQNCEVIVLPIKV